MTYVLDSCVAFKWLVTEGGSAEALRLRDEFLKGAHDLIAPDVFPVEVTNALTRAERQGRVLPPEGVQLFADLLRTLPRLVFLPRAYELSSQARIGVYDCPYVALAERESCSVVTADDRLVRTFPGGSVIPLSAL